MPPIDWNVIGRYVPEILLVVLFMGYTYLQSQADSKERIARADANALERKERDALFQQLFQDEREARTAWVAAMTGQVAQLVTVVTATNNLLIQHDTFVRTVEAHKEGSK